ncbi:MAG TPA: hypothetical protein VGK73_01435 [Polyangiaceae bacterium]
MSERMGPDEKRDLALLLWLQYYIVTELFDRSLPGAWSPHDPESWSPFESGPMLRHAREQLAATKLHVAELEIPGDVSEEQREVASGYGHSKQTELAQMLGRRFREQALGEGFK